MMRDAINGLYNGDPTYCPVNAYGDCPYCDQCNICHIDDPMEDCDDWQGFWKSWDEWEAADYYDEDSDNLEMGFNPYMGGYDYDC